MSPALVIFLLFSYLPFVRAVWLSLNITDGKGEPVRFNGLNYYANILNFSTGKDEYLKSIGVSFQFVLMVVPLELIAGLGLAALAVVKLGGIGLFRAIFTSSIAISLASAGVIWALIYNPAINITRWIGDWLNLSAPGLLANSSTALPAIALMTAWAGLGFNFVIALAGIQAIPQEIYESGLLDGAGGWKAFRYLTLPLLTPSLLFLFIIDTIQSFQAFTQFNVLMNGIGPEGSTNVFIYAAYRTFWLDNRYGFASAMSIVLFIILLLLTLLQYRGLDRRVHYR